MNVERLSEQAQQWKDRMVGWRRDLHRHPELSFQEVRTSRMVADLLQSFGSLEVSHPTPTSVMARLIGAHPGKVLALRADMDALPIQEENAFDYASRNPGMMHACGHDGHTAMLLAAAGILAGWKEEIHGEIRFLFQHAEEQVPGGARELVEAGVLEGVDAIIGAHLLTWLDYGKFGIAYGPMMASVDNFTITVQGAGGHAAYPHQTVDVIAIGAQIITNLQHIVARNTDPFEQLVVSVTEFHGGAAKNVLPNEVRLGGTIRCFSDELREQAIARLERIVRGVTEAHGATYNLEIERGYRPVVNDPVVTRLVERSVTELYGAEAVEILKPFMGSEDFSAYQKVVPGTFFMVGARNEAKGIVYPHHHPRFTFDEEAMLDGLKVLVHAALRFLAEDRGVVKSV